MIYESRAQHFVLYKNRIDFFLVKVWGRSVAKSTGTFAIYESRAQLLVLYKNRRNKFEERKKERETERERDRERDRERESEGPSAAYTSYW